MPTASLHRTGRPLVLSLALLCMIGLAGASSATEDDRRGLAWMSGDSIRGSFQSKKIAGQYPNGNLWFEQIFADGRTDYREGEKHWIGQWWVTAREFCFSYPPPGLGGCFRVVRLSPNCFELYDFSGELAREEAPPSLPSLWNGRMWLHDISTTCEQLSTS